MTSWLPSIAPVLSGPLLMQLDLNGYLYSQEFLAVLAGLVTAFLSGLANVFFSGFFAGTA